MSELSHDEVQELLSAFADGELGAGSSGEIEAHLSACARCRAALSVQRQLQARLARMPAPEEPGRLLGQIRSQLEGARQARAREVRRRATMWSGWAVAAALALFLVTGFPAVRSALQAPSLHPPMVVAALADYRGHAGRELPALGDLAARQATLPFGAEPLTTAGARLVSAWKTTLRGEPVSVFAYRVGDRLVLAYVVSEAMFFRQPVVRETVARQGRYVTSDGQESVVAWPLKNCGVLVVGQAPASELESLRT